MGAPPSPAPVRSLLTRARIRINGGDAMSDEAITRGSRMWWVLLLWSVAALLSVMGMTGSFVKYLHPYALYAIPVLMIFMGFICWRTIETLKQPEVPCFTARVFILGMAGIFIGFGVTILVTH